MLQNPETRIPTVDLPPTSITWAGCGAAIVALAIRMMCGDAVPHLVPLVLGKSQDPAATIVKVAATGAPPPIGWLCTSERNTSSDGLRDLHTATAEPIR